MSFRNLLAVVCLTVSQVVTASAQPPKPTYRLDNGLTVILRPMPLANQVAVVVLFNLGSDQDPAGKSGMTHLLEHLYCTAATGDVPARDFAAIVKRYGMGFNQQTGPDFTVFAGVVAAEKLEEEIKDAAARMGALHPTAADLDREVPRVILELENMYGRIPSLAGINHARAALHPIQQDGRRGGNPEQVKRLTLDELQALWLAHYKPCNAVLVLTGGFDADKARDMIRRYFAPIPPGTPPPAKPVQPSPRAGTVQRVRVKPIVPNARGVVSIGYAAPLPGSGDYGPFLLVVARLRARISNSWNAQIPPLFYAPLDDPTTIALQAELPAGRDAQSVLDELDGRLQAALKAKIQPQEKLWAVNSMSMLGTVDLPDILRFQEPYGLAFSIGRRWQLKIDGNGLRAAIERVTDTDLQRLATTVFDPAKRAAAIIEVEAPVQPPKPTIGPLLRAVGFSNHRSQSPAWERDSGKLCFPSGEAELRGRGFLTR
jgi:zinc protease